MAEILFETLLGALEATRGTAISPPTHLLNAEGVLTPRDVKRRPRERRATRALLLRSTTAYKGSAFEATGDLDVNEALFWLNMGLMTLAAPSSTPANGVLTRLWQFTRLMTADTEKSATLYWGDPNVQVWRTVFNMLTELSLENDAMADDGVLTFTATGEGKPMTKVADPTVPASIAGALLPGANMQAWLDTGATAIGTTAITNRILAASLTIPTGRTFKRSGQGATGDKSFTHVGIEPVNPEGTITLEVGDSTEWDLWDADTPVKLAVRNNGALIESVTPDYYNFLEWQLYGVLSEPEWGDYKGNRTVKFKILGDYNATPASDVRIIVQNARTSV